MKPKARQISKCLSKNVLQMKFMKKSALETQEKIAEEEKNKLIDNEHWYLNLPESNTSQNRVAVEKSYNAFNATIYGRLSFNGFNPEIEKIMQSKQLNGDGFKEGDVEEIAAEDVELAEYYQKNYRRTNGKRKRNVDFNLEAAVSNGNLREQKIAGVNSNLTKSENKKRKFMRPNLD